MHPFGFWSRHVRPDAIADLHAAIDLLRQVASDRAVLQGVFAATKEERLYQLQKSINGYKPRLCGRRQDGEFRRPVGSKTKSQKTFSVQISVWAVFADRLPRKPLFLLVGRLTAELRN